VLGKGGSYRRGLPEDPAKVSEGSFHEMLGGSGSRGDRRHSTGKEILANEPNKHLFRFLRDQQEQVEKQTLESDILNSSRDRARLDEVMFQSQSPRASSIRSATSYFKSDVRSRPEDLDFDDTVTEATSLASQFRRTKRYG